MTPAVQFFIGCALVAICAVSAVFAQQLIRDNWGWWQPPPNSASAEQGIPAKGATALGPNSVAIAGNNNTITYQTPSTKEIVRETVSGVEEVIKKYLNELDSTPRGKSAPPAPSAEGPWKIFDPVALTNEFQLGWSLFFVANGKLSASAFKPFQNLGHDSFDLNIVSLNDDDPKAPVFNVRYMTPGFNIGFAKIFIALPEPDRPVETGTHRLKDAEIIMRAVRSNSNWMYGVLGARVREKQPKGPR